MHMKTKPFHSCLNLATLLVAAITLLATSGAFAATYYWDCNDSSTTPTAFGTAQGTWSATTTGTTTYGWTTNSSGNATVNGNSVTTGSGDTVNFGSGNAGLNGGTVTVSGTVAAQGITFSTAASQAVTLSGGTINLGSSGIYDYGTTGHAINSAIALQAAGQVQVLFNTSPYTLTLGGQISGNYGMTFNSQNTSAGSETVLLNGQSTYTGTTTIDATSSTSTACNMTLQLGIDNALPTTTTVNLVGYNGSSSTPRYVRLDLNGHNQTIAAITRSSKNYRQQAVINTSATLGILTISNATAETFQGQIGYYGGTGSYGNTVNGSLSYMGLTKNGTGTLTLNPEKTIGVGYTGPTTNLQGILEFAGGSCLAATNSSNPYPGNLSIASGATVLFSGTVNNILGGAIYGSGTLTNSGTATVTLNNANSSFTGTMGVGAGGGTLALGASGDIGSATLVIGTNGTFDVSAQTTYTPGGSPTFSASGTGTSATTQATIKGGTTVSLGSQPITLTWGGATSGTDTTHPCLVVSPGALTLNNNPFTINGSTLGAGTYRLIQVGDGSTGTLNQNVSPAYTVTGTAIDGGKINVITNDGSGNLILNVSLPFVASTNAFLTSLALNPAGALTPAFASNVFTYVSSEAAGATPTVTVTNADLTASDKVSVNGGTPVAITSGVASSPLALAAGITNTITVQVTAQDTVTIYNYTVNVWVPSASPYYWDANGTVGGFGTAGGTWAAITTGSASQGWSTDSIGLTLPGNVATGTNDTLNFGTTSFGLAGGTITVSGTVNAGTLAFGSQSGLVQFNGGTINLAPSATIELGGGTNLSGAFNAGPVSAQINATTLTGAGTSLLITNGSQLSLHNAGTAGWGAGATATISGNSQVSFYSGAANALGGSTGYTIQLGDAVTGGSLYTGNSVSIPNNVVVATGSGFRFIALYDNNGTPGYVGNITAHTNLYMIYGGYAAGKSASVSGNDYVDSGVTVTYAMGSASGDRLNDSAIWDGPGSVAYTSAALTNVSPAFSNVVASSSAIFVISGAKTYSGGCEIYGFTNGSFCVVSNSSDTTPPNNGPFGKGTLTLGSGAALRASTAAGDTTLGNDVALAGYVTFPTVGSEVSLFFQGNVDLGNATRNINCNVGATVPGKMVDFQGVISNTGGINMTGTGWLRLSGANTYTGNTTISAGTLDIAQPYLAAGSTVSISNSAVLNLEFSATNVVAGIITNGVSLTPGVYGAADLTPFVTGSGYLQVASTGPSGPANLTNSFSGGLLSLSWPAGQGWRLQEQTNALSVGLSTNWNYITDGSVSSTNIMVDPNKPTAFYRLRYP
jgi:fibronectin-binding autotransporter adhesin